MPVMAYNASFSCYSSDSRWSLTFAMSGLTMPPGFTSTVGGYAHEGVCVCVCKRGAWGSGGAYNVSLVHCKRVRCVFSKTYYRDWQRSGKFWLVGL